MMLRVMMGINLFSAALHAEAPPPPTTATVPAVAPAITLRAGELSALIHLPDAEHGHYRGSRFDWSGMIGEVRLGGDIFWNEWNPSPNATADHDNATGPAMEFGMEAPVGYDDAAVGEGFIKIGVGVLKRLNDKPYFFRGAYPILDTGTWTVQPDDSGREVTFVQNLTFGDYGYTYEKRVALAGDQSLLIACRLVNTGSKPLQSEVYAHNFYRPGSEGWVPGLSVTFDQSIKPAKNAIPLGAADFAADAVRVTQLLPENQGAWIPLDYDAARPPRSYRVVKDGRLHMEVTFDFDPSRIVVYGLTETLCVEPFRKIDLQPGQHVTWSYTHRFEAIDK